MEREELTEKSKNSFTFGSAFSAGHEDSSSTPHRVPPSEVQGIRSEMKNEGARRVPSSERALSAAVVASYPEVASLSKWTRRSRPWNVSNSTAVATSQSIREIWFSSDDSTGPESLDPVAGSSKGSSCGQVAREGSRILDSLVQSASGRGRSRGRLLFFL